MDVAVLRELPICAGCERVLTGKVKVALCGCLDGYCEMCLADWTLYYCRKCNQREAPLGNERARVIVNGMYEDLWRVVAGSSTPEDKIQRLKGARERLKEAFMEAFPTVKGTSLPPAPPPLIPSIPSQQPESSPSLYHFPLLVQNLNQSQCEFCHARLSPNPAGRCHHCHKVNLRTVQFNREQFLSSKWECPKCKLRNVHSNQKCIDCGSLKKGVGRQW